MITYFNHVNMEIASYTSVKQLDFDEKKAFCCIYSRESFLLRPSDDIYLDFKIKTNTPAHLEAWINLLPCLKERGFKIEEHNWSTNKLKDDTIQLHILNRNLHIQCVLKKSNHCLYVLLGEKATDKI